MAQLRQRAPAKLAEDVVVADLTLGATGPELATDQHTLRDQATQSNTDSVFGHSNPVGYIPGDKGAVSSCIATAQITQRILDRVRVDGGQTNRQRYTDGITKPSRIIRRGDARRIGDPHIDDPSFLPELLQPAIHRHTIDRSGIQAKAVEWTERAQRVVQLISITGSAAVDEPLEFELQASEHIGIE